MPIPNTDICYQQPIQTVTLKGSREIPGNWLQWLVEQINDADIPNQSIISIINQFVIESPGLEDSLKQVYLYLQQPDISPESKQIILHAIRDGIDECAQGYHNRIQLCLLSVNFPNSIEKLISLYRYELVDNVARQIVGTSKEGVHIHNGVFLEANQMNIGVLPIRSDDIHRAMLADARGSANARMELETIFREKYTLLNILTDSYSKIKYRISHYGYNGKLADNNNYGSVTATAMIDFVKQYLPDMTADDIVVISNDGVRYVDINWQRIKLSILDRVINLGYFQLNDTDTTAVYYIKALLSGTTDIERKVPKEFYSIFSSDEELFNFIENFGCFTSAITLKIMLDKPDLESFSIENLVMVKPLLDQNEILSLLGELKPFQFIHSLDDLRRLLDIFPEYCHELFSSAAQLDKINGFIKNTEDLKILLNIVNNDSAYVSTLCDKIAFDKIIHDVYDLDQIFEIFDQSLHSIIIEKYYGIQCLAKLSVDVYSFTNIFLRLNGSQQAKFLASYNIKELITNHIKFKELLRYLSDNYNEVINNILGFEHIGWLASASVDSFRQVNKVLKGADKEKLLSNLQLDVLLPTVSELSSFLFEVDVDNREKMLTDLIGIARINSLVTNTNDFIMILHSVSKKHELEFIFSGVDMHYVIESEDDVFNLLSMTPRSIRFDMLKQIVEFNKLPSELEKLGVFLVRLGSKSFIFLQNYLNFQKQKSFDTLMQVINSIPENFRFELMQDLISFDLLLNQVKTCDQLRLILESLKVDSEHDEVIDSISESKWNSLIKSKEIYRQYADLLKPRHLKSMLTKFGDKGLLKLVPRKTSLDILCSEIELLKLPKVKYDVIFEVMSEETVRHIVNNVSTLNKYLNLLSSSSKLELINTLGVNKIQTLIKCRRDIYEVFSHHDSQYITFLMNHLGMSFIADFYYNATLEDFKQLFKIINDDDLKIHVIKQFSKLRCFDECEIIATDLDRKNLGLTGVQFDELLKSLGSRKLRDIFADTNGLVNLLLKLQKDTYKYTSTALLHVAENYEFKLILFGASFIAVGVLGVGIAATTAMSLVITPTLGVMFLGCLGINASHSAATLGTAILAGATMASSVGSLMGGAYQLHRRASIVELTNNVCGRNSIQDISDCPSPKHAARPG